jgi:hypothetical protein
MFNAFASSLLLLTAVACTPGPAPVSRSPHDPSNPLAQEGFVASLTEPPADAAPPATPHDHAPPHAHDAAGSAAGEAGDAVYTCPMHPEVTSDKPGDCPKCGMQLVPKK